jgi:lipopolysaccharide export system protein LptA
MKTICLIALIAVTAGMAARGQSNTNAAPQLLRLTDIYSDSAFFDGNRHSATYGGNVRVIASDMKLTCALLIADQPESGGRLNHVVAETNVVIDVTDAKGKTTHATGDKAVYSYDVQNGVTNETVTLTAFNGNPQPRVEDTQGITTADVIFWDRANNTFRASGHYHLEPKTSGAPAGTNAPAVTTNKLAATTIDLLPGTDTNYPPGSLDRVPGAGGRSGGGGF